MTVARRVERRCELRVGGVSLAFTVVTEGAAPAAMPRRRPAARIGMLLAAATLPAIGALAYVAPVPGGSYRVSMAIPSVEASAQSQAPRRAVARAARPAAVAVEPRAESPAEPAGDGIERAVRAALVTGDMQEWQGSEGTHGFVVAGPAEQGPAACRALSVLTRRADGTAEVEPRRACLDGDAAR